MRNRNREIVSSSEKVASVHEVSRVIFSWALLTVLRRVKTRHTVEVDSTSRCKRYQLVCGIFNCSHALRTRSTITNQKFPSRKRRSAALIASNALVQRSQRR